MKPFTIKETWYYIYLIFPGADPKRRGFNQALSFKTQKAAETAKERYLKQGYSIFGTAIKRTTEDWNSF